MSSTPYSFLSLARPARNGWPKLLAAWLPVLLLLSLLCLESSALFGADHTSAPLHSLTRTVAGTHLDPYWILVHRLIRKTGHFLGYGIFSLALLRSLTLILRPGCSWFTPEFRMQWIAIAGTFAVAALDEVHQAFLPNRTGKFADVLLDTAGALAFQLVVLLLGQIARWAQTCSEVDSLSPRRLAA